MSIAAIVLAAGASTRMGSPKQLLPRGGRSLLRRAAETALRSVCEPVYVVLGARAELVRREVQDLPVRVIENPRWAEGMGTSVRAGVEAAVMEAPEGLVLLLCDQPLITAEMVDALVAAYRQSRPPIVAAAYNGTLGVPALFSAAVFPELLALPPAEGARRLIAARRAEVVGVPLPAGAVDVDTPEDYQRLPPQA